MFSCVRGFFLITLFLGSYSFASTNITTVNTNLVHQPVTPALRLNLNQAVSRALEKNPDLLKAKAEIERLAGVTYEVRAGALPRLTLNSSFTETDDYLLGGSSGGSGGSSSASGLEGSSDQGSLRTQPTSEQWQIGVRLSKVLYNGGGTRALIAQAKIGEEAGFYQLQEVILDVIFNVRSNFYQVLVNRWRIAVEQQNVQLLEAELDRQKKFLEAGTVARFNVLRSEVALSNARPQLIEAQNQYRISLRQLAKLLAVNSSENEDFNDNSLEAVGSLEISPRQLNLKEMLHTAFRTRPSLHVADLGVSSELAGIRVARSGYYPRLEAFVDYGYSHDTFKNDLGSSDGGYTAGILGNWNIWDGLETKGRVDQAKAQWKSAVINKEDVNRGIDLEVRTAYSRFIEAAQLVESQKGNISLAEESIRLAQSRFDAGAGTQLEILDAQTELNRSRLIELQARYRYNVALAEAARSTGQDAFFSKKP